MSTTPSAAIATCPAATQPEADNTRAMIILYISLFPHKLSFMSPAVFEMELQDLFDDQSDSTIFHTPE
jgi:hypothetical protein